MSDKHLSSKFEADLHLLSTRLREMGGLVESQVARAMEALTTFDLASVEQVIEGEHRLNAMEIEIDEEVSNIIVRRQPAAGALRRLMATSSPTFAHLAPPRRGRLAGTWRKYWISLDSWP